MKQVDFAIVVHGGCGIWLDMVRDPAQAGCTAAVRAGREILAGDGSAFDAVVAACRVLEDDPVFNAGTGSVLDLDGQASMDASVMDGSTLAFGAVGALTRVRNPVLVAKAVMEHTDHRLLVSAGAVAFARKLGFADHEPRTPARIAEYEALRRMVAPEDQRPTRIAEGHPEHAFVPGIAGSCTNGTVGAVAIDRLGRLAVATSTGGMPLKLPGRLGDTPLPGGGSYASAHGAASSTGTGEAVMRILGTHLACSRMEQGDTAGVAIRRTLDEIEDRFATTTGMIAIDATGRIGVGHRTPQMPHAFCVGEGEITAGLCANGSTDG